MLISSISCMQVERKKLRATYKDSGVDIEAGNRSVEIIKKKGKVNIYTKCADKYWFVWWLF